MGIWRRLINIYSYRGISFSVFKQPANHSLVTELKKVRFIYIMSEAKELKFNTFNNIIKSEEDSRSYRGLELVNGMKVILVSDQTTDKSAAALDVHIGHLSDPFEIPGLAHFCEHMLFLGTEKYPQENEYNKFLSQHGGSSNAFTACDHTNYYFDVSPEHLAGALDRFAQFFICPLFTESATDREVSAVNSEYEKNLQNDAWRLDQLEKSTSNANHDYSKFGSGNLDTLDIIPKSKGIDIRKELLNFHSNYYSANIMALSVVGKETLEELEELVVPLFSKVENNNVTVPEWKVHPFDQEHLKLRGYVVPVKDVRNLNITFPIPDLHQYYRSNPGYYLGHLVGHEGPGSLLSELKVRGWANNLVGGYKNGAKGFAFFIFNVDLTEEGIEHTDDIVTLLFQYLNMLKAEKPQFWIFEECQKLSAMQFRFRDRDRPQLYAQVLSGLLHDYHFEELLCGPTLLKEYRPEIIENLLKKLTPDTIRIAIIGKKFEDQVNQIEKWYGTKYSLEPIEEEILYNWRNAGLHDNLKLPPSNEFIPSNFELSSREPEIQNLPSLIKNTEMCRLWFKQDNEFLLPKAVIIFELRSPLAYIDPYHHNLLYLFMCLLKDALNEYTYAAELAGLTYTLASSKFGIYMHIKGYNDKQHVLLEKIIDKMITFEIDQKRFDILKESYIRALKNFKAEQPHQHALYYTSLLLAERAWSNEELLDCVNELTSKRVQSIIPQLLTRLHIESLMHGNLTKQEALNLVDIVESKINKIMNPKCLLPSQLLGDREYHLEDGCHYVYEVVNEVHRCSSIETYYQCGLQEKKANIILELFCQIITEPCYSVLRTQEQLGYIVSSGPRRSNGVQGVRVVVQSDKSPSYVDSRIEAFFQFIDKYIQDMSDKEFEQHKQALSALRLEKPKKLGLQSAKYWAEIMRHEYNFDRDNEEVSCLSNITKDDLYAFFKELISFDAPKRKKLSVHVVSSLIEGSNSQNEEDTGFICEDTETSVRDLDGLIPPPPAFRPPVKIEDVTEFKSSLGLYPLVKPSICVPIPHLSQPSKSKL